MNIKRLKFYYLWSHKDTTIDFEKECYMILGKKIADNNKSNGSGKSAIPKAIAYCLFGDASLDGKKNDDIIYNDEKKMGVMLHFELNGINYTVIRKVTRGSSPKITIYEGEESIEYGVKAGQEIINSILGADYSIYKNTSYFKQGDISSFSTLTPKEAKEVVIKILQLDSYNKYEQIARDKSKELDAQCVMITSNTSGLETQLINEETNNKRPPIDTLGLEQLKKHVEDLKIKQQDAQVVKDGKDEILKSINLNISRIQGLITEKQTIMNEHNRRIDKLKNLKDKCPTCEHLLDGALRDTIIAGIQKEIIPLIKENTIYEEELNKANLEKEETDKIKIDTNNYNNDIATVSYKIGEIQAQLKQEKANIEKINNLKTEIKKLNVQFKNTNIEKDRYEILTQAFGKNGIQAYIIDNVIPEIQATTNDILEGLDTNIRVSIESQKDLKKGGKAETLDINVITEFGERPYSLYSGGEKTFIDFAIRIALSIILSRRSKCKIQTLILDEVFGELDTVNKRIISKALRFIAHKFDFKKILIISHAEELQDSFDNVIQVVFDGKSSSIVKEKINE